MTSGAASCVTGMLAPGTYSVIATYSGDITFQASSATTSFTIAANVMNTCPGFPAFPEPPGCADIEQILSGPFLVNLDLGQQSASPAEVLGLGQPVAIVRTVENNGPDPTSATDHVTVNVGGVVTADFTDNLPTATLLAHRFASYFRMPGEWVITATATGAIPDPVPTNNSKTITFDVYDVPAAKADPPPPAVKAGSGGQLGGGANSCSGSNAPASCKTSNFNCEETKGCVAKHHDTCLNTATGNLGACTSPRPLCGSSDPDCCQPQTIPICTTTAGNNTDPATGATRRADASPARTAGAFKPALEQLAEVRVALLYLAHKTRATAKDKCEWLTGHRHLQKRSCHHPLWINAHGSTHWHLAVGRLTPGHWQEYVQAVNAAGTAQVTFGPNNGSELAFRVR